MRDRDVVLAAQQAADVVVVCDPDDRGANEPEERIRPIVPAQNHENGQQHGPCRSCQQRPKRDIARNQDRSEEHRRGKQDDQWLDDQGRADAGCHPASTVEAQEDRRPRAQHARDGRQRMAEGRSPGQDRSKDRQRALEHVQHGDQDRTPSAHRPQCVRAPGPATPYSPRIARTRQAGDQYAHR